MKKRIQKTKNNVKDVLATSSLTLNLRASVILRRGAPGRKFLKVTVLKIAEFCHDQRELHNTLTMHKKLIFPLRISAVNLTKSTGNWENFIFRAVLNPVSSYFFSNTLKFYKVI